MRKNRRLGMFAISDDMLEKCPDLVKRIMGQCIILKAEHSLAYRGIEYVAECAHFKPLSDGSMMPTYQVLVEQKQWPDRTTIIKLSFTEYS